MGLQGVHPVSLGALSMGVAAILVIWLYMRRKTKVDEYRETLFTLRDELFDYMWQHNLPFDLPEYRRLREQLNQGIQVAAEVAPLSFLVAGLAVAVWGPCVSSNTPDALNHRRARRLTKLTASSFVERTTLRSRR